MAGKDKPHKPLLLMFQDETRFGRMSDPARCWVPALIRATVGLAMIHAFRYFYMVIGPEEGTLHWIATEKMNAENASVFLKQVAEVYIDRHVVMVVVGASSHRAKTLEVSDNMSLVELLPYSPELNSTEILWHE